MLVQKCKKICTGYGGSYSFLNTKKDMGNAAVSLMEAMGIQRHRIRSQTSVADGADELLLTGVRLFEASGYRAILLFMIVF